MASDILKTANSERQPDASIVIAAWPDMRGLSRCLESIAAQRDDRVEVVVASSIAAGPELTEPFHDVKWLHGEKERLIPQLWALGIASAQGDLVAITTAHFVPASDWIAQIRAAHQRLNAAGIGGAIDPPRGGSAADWATYFLRYSSPLHSITSKPSPISQVTTLPISALLLWLIGAPSRRVFGSRSFTGSCSPPARASLLSRRFGFGSASPSASVAFARSA